MSILTRIRVALWAWKNRCRDGRTPSSFYRTATAAQGYLFDLRRWFKPCKVCGSLTCRWAEVRKAERIPTPAEVEQFERMIDHFKGN